MKTSKAKAPAAVTAVYVRISEDRDNLELGIDRQRSECAEVCQRRGWPDPVIFEDNDISASTGKFRPGYAALTAAVGRGEVARVVVYHPSRIWRNRQERANGIEMFKQHKVSMVNVRGPELDFGSAYGRLAADLFGAFDSAEGEVKSERIKSKILQRAQAGELNGTGPGNRLHGYDLDGKTIIESEAEQVRGWFRRFVAGQSVGSLAREAGVDRAVMRRRLLNGRYAGLRVYQGQAYPAAWPAIVDKQLWETVQRMLTDPARATNGGSTERKWLGSGLYGCARCEIRRIYNYAHNTRGVSRQVYRCRPDFGGCSRIWHRERVDVYVNALIEARLGLGDLADLLPKDRPDLDALRDEAEGIRGRLKRLRSDYILLGMDETDLREGLAEGRARLKTLEAQLGDPRGGGALGELVAAEDPVKYWRDIPAEQVSRKQAIVRALGEVRLEAPPRGKPPTDWEESVVWYGDRCVVMIPRGAL